MKANKKHWENIYATKGMQEVSWYQKLPQTSLNLISQLQLNKHASIIDIGAGDSFLVDELLKLGYTNISVLDISVNAIERAKKRLGELAENVKWIVTDITEFNPTEKFDLWHDRAVFHFLTQEKDINIYKKLVDSTISGYFLLSTFSDEGPDKCSGLEICKYSEMDLKNQFEGYFTLIDSFKKDHNTPFETIQNFTFSLFRKLNG